MDFLYGLTEKLLNWEGIPASARYCILVGLVLLGLDWISDVWWHYYRWGIFNFHHIFFDLGNIFICLGLIIIPLTAFFTLSIYTNNRSLYSPDKAYNTFYLVSFNGCLVLFDHTKPNKKLAYLIQGKNTLKNLGLTGSVQNENLSYGEAMIKNLKINMPDNKVLTVNDYKFDYRFTLKN
jgi:hypothetical protein